MAFRSRRSSFARNLKALDPEYVDYDLDGGFSAAEKNQWFFEVGWEVANKVGGIYTVIRTKAAVTVRAR